jgi:hypothetical protein
MAEQSGTRVTRPSEYHALGQPRRLFRPGVVVFLTACLSSWVAYAQLAVVSNAEPQSVFGGGTRLITVTLRNAGEKLVEFDARTRLFQTTSATAVQIGEPPWKRIQVLPGQTILEAAALDFPAVKAETRFIVQWWESTNHMFGTTEVLVYPTNLLEELKSLVGNEELLGVLDPTDQLKPLLKSLKMDFVDLGESSLENFRGKLAVIGPFASKAQMPEELANRIQTIARKGVAVVWILPPLQPSPQPSPIRWEMEKLQPSFYSVPEGGIAVIVVQPELIANLSENPQSQLNLIRFCRLALHPEPPHLPHLNPQP